MSTLTRRFGSTNRGDSVQPHNEPSRRDETMDPTKGNSRHNHIGS